MQVGQPSGTGLHCFVVAEHTKQGATLWLASLCLSFLNIFCWLWYYSFPIFFSSLFPSTLYPSSHQHSPQLSWCTCKFFGFSISHTILNIPLSIVYLPIILLIPCTFSLILPLHFPTGNAPCALHFCGSVPVLVVCLVFFCFGFRCGC